MFASSRASRSFDESREECESDERRCDDSSDRGEVQATRLFDKLDQLEKRWQTQKSHQRKQTLPVQVLSVRDQPEPCLVPTFSTVATFDSDRAFGKSDSFTSTVSTKSDKQKNKKKPRVVSMFDRLYQKGKEKAITRGRNVFQQQQAKAKGNRNKRRQNAAVAIQAIFRGSRHRKKLRKLSQNAQVVQKWWSHISQRLFYLKLRDSTLTIQSLERRRKALQQARRRRKAVLTIQGYRRVHLAQKNLQELIELRKKRVHESSASPLIQGMMIKRSGLLRTDIVECRSLIVEEKLSDEMETFDCAELLLLRTPSLDRGRTRDSGEDMSILTLPSLESPNTSMIPNKSGIQESVSRTKLMVEIPVTNQGSLPASENQKIQVQSEPQSSSATFFRAAQARRRAMKAAQGDPAKTPRTSNQIIQSKGGADSMMQAPSSRSTPRKYKSIAYDYLPTKKTYWSYDARRLEKVPILQRWMRQRLQHLRRRRASIGIQCAWRIHRAQFNLISSRLLKEWSVRVDFHQEETTNNPILRQKVRLLALTKAIRRVNDECISQEVMRTPYSVLVSWKTETSIYFGEDQFRAEMNRCSIHVICEAHRHPLWENWSSQKKFTLLSKAALMKSFANQCARLSRASVLLQSLTMRRILQKMSREKEAAMTIQRFWKQYSFQAPEKQYLRLAKKSTIRLQAWWRMTMCIYMVEIQEMSACSIQAAYRGHIERTGYMTLRKQFVSFQSVYRGWRQRTNTRLQYCSAVRIQQLCRGYLVRLTQHKRIYATLAIQDWYRAVALRVCMSKIRLSYSILQCLVQRQAILSRLKAEQAAVLLQSWWRMKTCRAVLVSRIKSARAIQAAYRGYKARVAFEDQVQAQRSQGATSIQRWWRKVIQYKNFLRLRSGTLSIQRLYRGHEARKRCNEIIFGAALQIQTWWRMTNARDEYNMIYLSILDVQRLCRGHQTRTTYKTMLEARRLAASIRLQAWWRMVSASRKLNREIRAITSATRLQAWWRMTQIYNATQRRKFQATQIQRMYRGYKGRVVAMEEKVVRSATILQAWYRMSRILASYQRLRRSISDFQRIYRCHRDRVRYTLLLRSSLVVQKIFRGHAARCRYETLLKANIAAALIQFAWDEYRERKATYLYNTIVLVQKVYRGHRIRRQIDPVGVFLRSKVSVSRFLEKRHSSAYRQMQLSAMCIQSCWRTALNKQGYLLVIHRSAKIIQGSYRKYLARCLLEKRTRAAVKVQAWSRMACNFQKFEDMLVAAIIVQCWARMVQTRHYYLKMLTATTVIQSFSRANASKAISRKRLNAIVTVQSFWRRSMCVLAFQKLRQYLTSFQAIYRGVSVRFRLQRELSFAEQRYRRQDTLFSESSISMHDYGDEHSAVDVTREYQLCSILTFPADKTEISATIVQTMYRSYASRQMYLKAKSSAIIVQRSWRLYSCLQRNACTRAIILDDGIEIERMPRRRHIVWKKKIRTLASILVQSWWRAEQQRRKFAVLKIQSQKAKHRSLATTQSIINELALTNSGGDKTEEMSLQPPFWLFNPELVLSLPVSLASCLDTTRTMDILCGEPEKTANKSAIKIQQWWIRQREARRELVSEPTTLEEVIDTPWESRPITRLEVRNQLRLFLSASSRIQSWWKAKLYQIMSTRAKMATRIQSVVRLVLSRRYSLRLRSVLIIQRRYRANSCLAAYRRMHSGFIELQQAWLRYASLPEFRERIKKRNSGITALQKLARQHFIRKKASAVRIQQQWRFRRGLLALQAVLKRRFMKRTMSACILQRSWRKALARAMFLRVRNMTTCLQSRWRGSRDRMAFKKQRHGFSLLQIRWVAAFQRKTNATIEIQRIWRMKFAKSVYYQEREAAVMLQKTWRKRTCCSAYRKMCAGFMLLRKEGKSWFTGRSKSVVLLQRTWRSHSKREEYRKLYRAICFVQKIAKQRFIYKRSAATALQKRWRMITNRSQHKKALFGCICIQRFLRGFERRSKYLKLRKSIVAIQAIAKQKFLSKTKSATILQRHQRMRYASKIFVSQRSAAIVVQTKWRLFSVWSKYITMYCGFCGLQEAAKRSFDKKTVSAAQIQRKARMYLAKTNYGVKRCGAILIQRQCRRQICERLFNIQLKGFTALQVVAKQHYKEKARAATLLQAQWRLCTAKFAYKKKRSASIVLQSQFRGLSCKSAYAKMRPGFISLQVLAKLWFRIKNTCAIQIQAAARQMMCRKRFQLQRRSIVKAQSVFRGFVQRRNLAVLRWLHSVAATMIASWWRRISHEFKYRNFRNATLVLQYDFRTKRRNKAATRIQTWWRCLSTLHNYQTAKSAAIVIEEEARYFLVSCRRRRAAASKIQKAWKECQQRFLVRCLLILGRAKAAIVLQRWWREVQLLRQHKKMLNDAKKRRATETARRSRNKKQNCDPVSLLCDFDFGTLAGGFAIPNIVPWTETQQTRSHSEAPVSYHSEKRRARSKALDARLKIRAAVIIQRHWREFRRSRAKEYYKKSISAAWIQAIWRGYSARRRYNLILGNKAAASLQAAWQNVQQRRLDTRQSMRIQSAWRGYVQRSRYSFALMLRNGASTLIQRAWRMSSQRQTFVTTRAAAQKIQRLVRRVKVRDSAAQKIQRAWWIFRLRGTVKSPTNGSRRGSNLSSMVLQAGVAWILSDPRVIEFALKGATGA